MNNAGMLTPAPLQWRPPEAAKPAAGDAPGHGNQDRPRRAAHRLHRAPRQGQRERRAPRDRGGQRGQAADRRQGGEVQAGAPRTTRPTRRSAPPSRRSWSTPRSPAWSATSTPAPPSPPPEIYNQAGIPVISGSATNPKLTEQGFKNVVPRRRPRRPAGPGDRQLPRRARESPRSSPSSTTARPTARASPTRSRRPLKAANVKVLPREKGTDKDTDFKAMLTKMRGQQSGCRVLRRHGRHRRPDDQAGARAGHQGGVRVRRRRLHRQDDQARRRGRRKGCCARRPASRRRRPRRSSSTRTRRSSTSTRSSTRRSPTTRRTC